MAKFKRVVPFVLAIVRQDDKYLLTRRYELDREDPRDFHNKWQLVGGGINFGETAQEAIIREVEEEVGIKVKILSVVPYIINSMRKEWQGHGIIFLSQPVDKESNIKLNHEASKFDWFTEREIRTLDALPGVKNAIKVAAEISGVEDRT